MGEKRCVLVKKAQNVDCSQRPDRPRPHTERTTGTTPSLASSRPTVGTCRSPAWCHAIVGDQLYVEPHLEVVRAADPREVVDDLPDALVEVEARGLSAIDGLPEGGDTAHEDRRAARRRRRAQSAELVTPRELNAQLVELVRSEGRHELEGRRVHPVVEVGRSLGGVEVAGDVERRRVLEEVVAAREAMLRQELRIDLPQCEVHVPVGMDAVTREGA